MQKRQTSRVHHFLFYSYVGSYIYIFNKKTSLFLLDGMSRQRANSMLVHISADSVFRH